VFLFSDPNVDHHLKVILKRMQKKDPVTKQKAIADFLELNDVEMLVPLLPHWPRMYKSLAIDTDRKVRDLGHKAWQHIALLCKKEVVPFLKAIAPFWILGTCDIYDETAKSALIALNKIFEEKDKRKKVFQTRCGRRHRNVVQLCHHRNQRIFDIHGWYTVRMERSGLRKTLGILLLFRSRFSFESNDFGTRCCRT
jgi:hypothetical protein